MDMEQCIQRQRAYFATGETKEVAFRKKALQKMKDAVRARESELLHALRQDLNKPPMEGYMTEVGMVLEDINYALRHVEKWARPRFVPTPVSQFPARSYIWPEPYGVVLVMAPWNYPFQLCLEPLIGAIAAGNCAIIKPSAYAPNTSQAVASLIASCFQPEYVTVVQGGREQNRALLEQKLDYIFFTGSVTVGKEVMAAAARTLTPVSLELGGKSPCIVADSADIPLAAKRIAFGKFLNGGQTCVAPDYVLVQKGCKGRLIKAIAHNIQEFFPQGMGEDYPAIINEKHFARLIGLMEGEHVAIGGQSDPARCMIAPTVLDQVSWDAPIMQEEIFGPILPVLEFENIDQAIRCIKARPNPLALYLFANDRQTQRQVLQEVSFGGGCINDTIMHLATPYMGFGGVGQSGMGSYHGKCSFDTFSHEKSILKKANWLDLPMRYRPYTKKKENMVRKFLG